MSGADGLDDETVRQRGHEIREISDPIERKGMQQRGLQHAKRVPYNYVVCEMGRYKLETNGTRDSGGEGPGTDTPVAAD